MRSLVVAIGLIALASCGKSEAPAKPAEGAAQQGVGWEAALTASPTVLRTFKVTDLGAVPGSKLAPSEAGVSVETASGAGSYATMLYLGPLEEFPTASALRVNADVKSGKLYFITTSEEEKAGEPRFELVVLAGESKQILLPLDKRGRTILIVANANGEGASKGTLKSIELLAPPA